ncbi:HD domain-containing protein [Alkalibacter mobilis]|uniref:HD domain-containing protein n=1 Tax=Alkalibacter mobilis TaxID=2787712 RepID=UPI0018A0F49E|nr:HD domain-containing protein [Alkalibacter mobilis]MBF7096953.1 HD domain-containing protein [Alkalibacter mobilis]
MERINRILVDEIYLSHLNKIKEHEKQRIFCRHDITHFLDVARIAWIITLERNLNFQKEIVYACGLLHDIGRWLEYEEGTDHALASGEMCVEILEKNGFDPEEIRQIKKAIASHRVKCDANEDLSALLYESDKASRRCYSCDAIGQCKKFQNGEIPEIKY